MAVRWLPDTRETFSCSLLVFIQDAIENERFPPTLPGGGACQPERQKLKPKHPKSTKTWLNVNEWEVQRKETREWEDILRHELEAMCFVVCSLKFEKNDGHEYEAESLAVIQCSLKRHLKYCVRDNSILCDCEFPN